MIFGTFQERFVSNRSARTIFINQAKQSGATWRMRTKQALYRLGFKKLQQHINVTMTSLKHKLTKINK